MKALEPTFTTRSSRCRANLSGVEPLESRVAPAGVFTFTDVDGDLVTIKSSEGTDADLAFAINVTPLVGLVPDAQRLECIVLSDSVFDGTDVSVKARPGPAGGDGLVSLPIFNAPELELGRVTIDGDLGDFDGGKANGTIEAISVHSTSGSATWTIHGSVGKLKVKTDLKGSAIDLNDTDATLGTLEIGGSLIGENGFQRGYIVVANGTIDLLKIGGDLRGGEDQETGHILARNIGTLTVGGSIIGGTGLRSGNVSATDIDSISIGGNLIGGSDESTGLIHCDAELGKVKIGGSVIGGSAQHSGSIECKVSIGKVTIGGNLQGGSAPNTGDIYSTDGGIAGVQIGGSLIGGTASYSGRIVALGLDVGAIKIGGDLQSVERGSSGAALEDSGVIYAIRGDVHDEVGINVESITVGGSVIGASNNVRFQIVADGMIGPVSIGHDLKGGFGIGSGAIQAYEGMSSVKIGGNVIGGKGYQSGSLLSNEGEMSQVKVGGSIVGGAGDFGGRIYGKDGIGNVTINGDLASGSAPFTGQIQTQGPIGAVKIGGDIQGTTPFPVAIQMGATSDSSRIVMKSLSVAGNVEHAQISSVTDPDVRIGAVTVGGNWTVSNLVAGAQTGWDLLFGTADDVRTPQAGEPDGVFSRIASITIVGHVIGTATSGGDHYGFVSEEIGSLRINGLAVPLTPGTSNDSDVNDPHLILGPTRDVTVHEVP
jgi:hypothetical protein